MGYAYADGTSALPHGYTLAVTATEVLPPDDTPHNVDVEATVFKNGADTAALDGKELRVRAYVNGVASDIKKDGDLTYAPHVDIPVANYEASKHGFIQRFDVEDVFAAGDVVRITVDYDGPEGSFEDSDEFTETYPS